MREKDKVITLRNDNKRDWSSKVGLHSYNVCHIELAAAKKLVVTPAFLTEVFSIAPVVCIE